MIRVTMIVENIDVIIQLFPYLRLYTADDESGPFTHLAYIALEPGQTTYIYDDVSGTPDTWYATSYYSTSTESELSDPVQGTTPELYHWPVYPEEFEFEWDEQKIIRKIRRLIGDFKSLKRLYINEETGCIPNESCAHIHQDSKTLDLGEKGWPVYVSIQHFSDDAEEWITSSKSDPSDPIVQGYQYLTFSGALNSGTRSDIIDVWYYSFTFSDREVYEAYGDSMIPAGLTSSTVTQDHLVLVAAIDLLENLTSDDMINDGAEVRDDNSTYNPSPGLLERDKTIKRLKTRLDELVKQYLMSGITGVLID